MSVDRGALMEQVVKAMDSNAGALVLSHDWRCTVASKIVDGLIEQCGEGLFTQAAAVEVVKQARELRAAMDHHGAGSLTDTPALYFDQLWRALREADRVGA